MVPYALGLLAALALTTLLLDRGASQASSATFTIDSTDEVDDGTSTATPGMPTSTWYVRPDGGSPEGCTGLVDAPYPGSGTDQPCAWDHPFRALPPGGPPRIAGGDTLIIGTGSYMMGYGAPGADNCGVSSAWDCFMSPVPSGPDPANPTRILGAGWDTGNPGPPELWGTERAYRILNLADASNVEIAWLEITDHSSCVEFHTGGLACERATYPFGDWVATGLYAEDSANVHLRDLNIHGLASQGVHAGRLSDWTVEDVRIAGNGWAGWDGDISGNDSSSGTLLFRRWTVEWNGCGESYPGGQPAGCWGQTAGGYGDGVGTGATGGHWVIEDSAFLHNTSDGLDLLYVDLAGSSIELRRTIAEGNAGNQIKTNGPTLIENSIVVANCGYFDGQPFTYNVDNCRAAGNALSLDLRPGNQVTVTNSTLTGEGDCLVLAGCAGGPCDGFESVRLRNNIFQGQVDFLAPSEQTCLVWAENFPHDPFDIDYSLVADVKDDACPGPHDICGVSPGLVNSSIDAFDAHLLESSPAIDAGTTDGAPADDFDAGPRDTMPDIGAYEWGAPTPTATPTVTPTATSTSTATPTGTPIACPPGTNFDGDIAQGGPGIGNGPGVAGHDGTVAMSDAVCDDADPDDDNDGIPDASDSDPRGDITYDDNNDGNPCPPLGTDASDDGPSWDANCNGVLDGAEVTCSSLPDGTDSDGDGLDDKWETCKWGTDPNTVNSDGDALNDCVEAADVNGDGIVDFVVDVIYYAKAALLPAASFGRDGDFDINGDGMVDFVVDVVEEARFALIPGLCQ